MSCYADMSSVIVKGRSLVDLNDMCHLCIVRQYALLLRSIFLRSHNPSTFFWAQ